MSIKKKKPLIGTKNAYRLKRIERYLISEGYINIDPSQEFQRWVDCVSHGRDICFYTSDITIDRNASMDRELREIGGYGKDGYFKISNPRKHEIYTEAHTIEDAVKRSRHYASWKL